MPTLAYDFEQEKTRQMTYRMMGDQEIVRSVTQFISGIWQIHPFREGNTRTCAVFLIKYLNNLGFVLNDDLFSRHAKEFRDSLALANGTREVRDDTMLQNFVRSAALSSGDSAEIGGDGEKGYRPNFDVAETIRVLKNSSSLAQASAQLGVNRNTVNWRMEQLEKHGLVKRNLNRKMPVLVQ
jgi:prophage maintenance system killer protein